MPVTSIMRFSSSSSAALAMGLGFFLSSSTAVHMDDSCQSIGKIFRVDDGDCHAMRNHEGLVDAG